jgi:hypothetical protein
MIETTTDWQEPYPLDTATNALGFILYHIQQRIHESPNKSSIQHT